MRHPKLFEEFRNETTPPALDDKVRKLMIKKMNGHT